MKRIFVKLLDWIDSRSFLDRGIWVFCLVVIAVLLAAHQPEGATFVAFLLAVHLLTSRKDNA